MNRRWYHTDVLYKDEPSLMPLTVFHLYPISVTADENKYKRLFQYKTIGYFT